MAVSDEGEEGAQIGEPVIDAREVTATGSFPCPRNSGA